MRFIFTALIAVFLAIASAANVCAEQSKMKLNGKIIPFTVQGSAGKIVGVAQLPELKVGDKCPVVIICHGFRSDCQRPLQIMLANDLASKGIGAVRFDFDGAGQSDGRFDDMTVSKEIEDLKNVINWAREQPFTASVSLAGHSQGGVVAAMTAGELGYPAVSALALMAPAAVLRDDALRGLTGGARFDPWNVPEYVPLPGHDMKVGRDYVLTAQKLPIYETALKYMGPVFILQGAHDVVVPYTYAERFHEGYKNSELKIVLEEDHSFTKFTAKDALAVSGFFAKILR